MPPARFPDLEGVLVPVTGGGSGIGALREAAAHGLVNNAAPDDRYEPAEVSRGVLGRRPGAQPAAPLLRRAGDGAGLGDDRVPEAAPDDRRGRRCPHRAGQCIRRAMQPDDKAGVTLFLASDAGLMLTARTIIVDGGRQ